MLVWNKFLPENVRRILRDANFYGRTAKNKPRSLDENKDISFRNSLILEAESKFDISTSDRKVYVWGQSIEKFTWHKKHGVGHVMV